MMKLTPMKAASAAAAARITSSDLDLHDLLDRRRTDGDHEDTDADHDVAEVLGQHRPEVRRRDDGEHAGHGERQAGDDDPRDARLRRQRADLTLDADALADRVRNGVEDFGEVAAADPLDLQRGDQQVEVLGLVALHHVVERLVDTDAERDLAGGPRELLADRRGGGFWPRGPAPRRGGSG